MSDLVWKIGLFSLIFSAIVVSSGLLLAVIFIWLNDKRKARKCIQELRAELKANEDMRVIIRRRKEREARRNMKNDEFSRRMWEILNEYQ